MPLPEALFEEQNPSCNSLLLLYTSMFLEKRPVRVIRNASKHIHTVWQPMRALGFAAERRERPSRSMAKLCRTAVDALA